MKATFNVGDRVTILNASEYKYTPSTGTGQITKLVRDNQAVIEYYCVEARGYKTACVKLTTLELIIKDQAL